MHIIAPVHIVLLILYSTLYNIFIRQEILSWECMVYRPHKITSIHPRKEVQVYFTFHLHVVAAGMFYVHIELAIYLFKLIYLIFV